MPLFTISLDSGREIRVVSIYQFETFEGGLAIGRQDEARVERECRDIDELAKKISPPTPVQILRPSDLGEKSWCLPYRTIITWFVSDPLRERCGSHLAVVVFQNEVYPPYNDDNRAMIGALDWETHAEDFDY